ncbi:uncharacterized protein BDCG_03103 [Blastomyces dermatitidis ER-3]|uniref:Uncharacterized protein n=1 Tax=Ajellomyces dermatitidis (strain ER-3 / ATCC MYA-2586) TaxID=559297 RepID=A0ABP2EYV8_AJEDR|nr:uncharacterized protein BDCG_03103 [Blastomyces dermatitidis ER-3]EEQ87983.1 hypothetical protein BDCG_03103 [Blastomyces dermatitidis ER-3]
MEQDRCLTRSGSCQPLRSTGLDKFTEKQAFCEPTQGSDAGRVYSQMTAEKHTVMITEI